MRGWWGASGWRRSARLPTDADVASEFRYRAPPLPPEGLGLLVSQSGETADTMAALRYMQDEGQHVLSIVNVPESSMARESDVVLETLAGPEIGVASTKAFTAQLTVLAAFALAAGRARGTLDPAREAVLTQALMAVPGLAAEVLEGPPAEAIGRIAERIAEARDVLYLGRGSCFPIALEGGAEAQGDQLHPCGRLCGGRDEAWADRADRPACAGGGDRALGAAVREDGVEPAGGGGAGRAGDRVQLMRRGRSGFGAFRRRRWCCRIAILSWRRSSTRWRCSCWRIGWRC